MRRKDREVKDRSKILEIIKSCDCCRIAFKEKEGTYILPLNFGLDDNENNLVFYFHGAKEGKKIELIKEQPIVGFELDTKHELVIGKTACAFSYCYQSVIGKGEISLVNDLNEKNFALNTIMKQYSSLDNTEFSDHMLNSVAVIKLKVLELSCKEH